ncbi:MAG: 4Fe-4S dicluster domain-containing protein [Ignavibacteria bacterium]|nr:4Fe-4S dicluster domain-containing protein [Ignavibacteria bacterium]
MEALQKIAKEALASKEAAFIIGYARVPGSQKTRPFIARDEAEAGQLVFDEYCQNNLAVYLTRIARPKEGKMGIVAKSCDVRAIVALLQENQIKRNEVYIIGVNCSGVVEDPAQPLSKENLAGKCNMCQAPQPAGTDTVVGEAKPYERADDKVGKLLAQLDSLSPQERFAFWEAEFEKCVKCYACRQACPLCYCEQCIADKSQPRWIESSASVRGNFAWNMIRAFHLAGRCIGCGECSRACPADIPLMLLNRKMGMIAMKEFNYRHGSNMDDPTLVGSYNNSDRNDFIM